MRLALALAFAIVQCAPGPLPPHGQILLFVDTDAPVVGNATPLFDRLAVDVYDSTGAICATCSRIFSLSTAQFAAPQGISFGIDAAGESGWSVRLRIYHTSSTLSGLIPDDLPDGSPPLSVIDATMQLPPIPNVGILERTAFLPTDSIGARNTIVPTNGRPQTFHAGTWSGATQQTCVGDPSSDEVCIPGGAYWMGNPRLRATMFADSVIRRLVVLSPFFMKQTEVTVREMRSFSSNIPPWSGNTTGDNPDDYCTFTTTPGPNENKPVTCVKQSLARAFCQSRGGDIPTEAQFEYVAGALRSSTFVWGDDSGIDCADAVLGRAGWGLFAQLFPPCKPATPPGGPFDVGTAKRDHLDLEGGSVFDLVGNESEWARDGWNSELEPCWRASGVFVDPICSPGGPKTVVRGGSWHNLLAEAAAAARTSNAGGGAVDIGFRCVRDAR
jgi:formylglycine-generating enzyme required for sulfatase activity